MDENSTQRIAVAMLTAGEWHSPFTKNSSVSAPHRCSAPIIYSHKATCRNADIATRLCQLALYTWHIFSIKFYSLRPRSGKSRVASRKPFVLNLLGTLQPIGLCELSNPWPADFWCRMYLAENAERGI